MESKRYCPIKDGYCNENCMFWSHIDKFCLIKEAIIRLIGG